MKYIIGFWTLIPYSYDENLFTNEGDINILQAVVIDSEEIEPNGFVGQNRRLDN